MKKIIIILLIVVIIIMGIYVYGIHKDLTLNDYFETSNDYTVNWDDASKEVTVHKEFPLKFNQTYKNVTTEIEFDGENGELDTIDVVNNTRDGKLVVHTTQKLSSKPVNIEFDIHDGILVDSDSAGLDYGRGFHLF